VNSNLTHAFAPQAAAIQRFPLFSDLSNADCATIISAARQKLFLKKRIIFFDGDPIEQVVLLLSGSAKITQFGPTGTEVILRVNRLGDVLGGFGAALKDRQCCTAETLEDCRALVWESATFQILADRFPVVRRNLMRILEERLRDLDERFREVSTENVASRLSSQLVRLANQIGKQEAEGVQVNLSQQELARLTGTTLFTVSRLLAQWEKEGTVTTRREVISIRSIPALAAISMKDDLSTLSES
jgi:CRP-like cAMP-binding protein